MAAFRHVLHVIADGEFDVTSEIVQWLERGLDQSLEAYASAAKDSDNTRRRA